MTRDSVDSILARKQAELATWEPCIVWWPVWVDAYGEDDRGPHGELSWKTMGRLERKWSYVVTSDPGEDVEYWTGYKYRRRRT